MVTSGEDARRTSFSGPPHTDDTHHQPTTPADALTSNSNDNTSQDRFNRDAPPHTSIANSTILGEEEDESSFSDLPELRPLGRSLTLFKVKPETASRDSNALRATLRAFYKYARNDTLVARRRQALEFATQFFKNPELLDLKTLDRSICRRNFVYANKLLDQLLGENLRFPLTASKARELKLLPGAGVLSVDPIYVIKVSHQLEAMGQAALRSFKRAGQQLPEVPTWPQEAGSAGIEFLLENDFEIMGITYRAQVEHYMNTLCELHDFGTGESKLLDILCETEPNPYVPTNSRRRDNSPPRSFATDSISNSVWNRRQDALAPDIRGTASYSHSSRPPGSYSLPQQSRRVREMWKDGDDSDHSGSAVTKRKGRGGDPEDDPSDSSDDEGNGRRPRRRGTDRRGERAPRASDTHPSSNSYLKDLVSKFRFDMKLKFENVPTWDGNTENIMQWINEVNDLARHNDEVRIQLGSIVPRRLTSTAKRWYYSLPREHRSDLEKDWRFLREEIAGFYMNWKWSEEVRRKATRATYREPGH
ncbi:hypothetical protein AAF712_016343 [Marasmius tenuissimus]|uniref:Retrotransposon gag domain-containing protein n=1 Tax=Marasmius tenuissimus TaxID=585030 RepID=A0ABR2Z6Z9_9AGAR